jgi:hypothetical protein
MKADATLKPNSVCLSRTEEDAVREQLARILASVMFRNSKRFPDFLRFTVEHTLNGDTTNLRERTLGVEIFGRDPSYDTGADSVVRVTAIEVRKRLSQYYQVPGHESELRIEFSPGSYVPEFAFPADFAPATVPSTHPVTVIAPRTKAGRWAQVATIAVVAACCVFVSGFLWMKYSPPETALDQFWAPVMDSHSSVVLLCIADISTTVSSYLTDTPDEQARLVAIKPETQLPLDIQRDKISFVDSLVLMRVAVALGKRNKEIRLFRTEDAVLDDLKEGPAVLVGGMNNKWIDHLNKGLRYDLANDGPLRYVRDRQNPSSREWGSIREEHPQTGAAYGIVSRVFDPVTGQTVVTVAGVRSGGTAAAGECLADSQCVAEAAGLSQGDWKQSNIQFVIQAPLLEGNPGHPHVLAAYLWQH